MRHLLWHLLAGTRGGETRIRLLDEIEKGPVNAHQLSKRLKLDYKTVQHHLRILEKQRLLSIVGGYGASLFWSGELQEQEALFQEIKSRVQPGPNSGKMA